MIVSWNGVNGTTAYSVEVTSIQNGVTGGSTLVTFTAGCTGRSNNNNNVVIRTNSTSSPTVAEPDDLGSSTGPEDQVNSTEPIDQVNSTKIKCNGELNIYMSHYNYSILQYDCIHYIPISFDSVIHQNLTRYAYNYMLVV